MEQINVSVKCCGTCVYWLGQRSPHRLGFVSVISKTDYGRCGATELTQGRLHQALYNCRSYCKWQALK